MREVGVDASYATPDPDAIRPRSWSTPRSSRSRSATSRRAATTCAGSSRANGSAGSVRERQAVRGDGVGVGRARCPSCRRCRRWPSVSTPRSARRDVRGRRAARVLGAEDGRARRRSRSSDAAFGGVGRRGEVPRPRLRRRAAAIAARPPLAGRAPRRRGPAASKHRAAKGSVRAAAASPTRRADGALLVREYGTSARRRGGCSRRATTARSIGSARSPTPTSSRSWCSHGDDRRRVHTLLRDQRTVSGVGRGYADDALWRAQLSPYASLAIARRRAADPPARGGAGRARRRARARAWPRAAASRSRSSASTSRCTRGMACRARGAARRCGG